MTDTLDRDLVKRLRKVLSLADLYPEEMEAVREAIARITNAERARVRELVWHDDAEHLRHAFYAASIIGNYRVEHVAGSWRAFHNKKQMTGATWDREGKAQAFCQSHYEAAIRSAITDPQDRGVANWHVERHDEEDGSISWEIWDHDPANYRRVVVLNDDELHQGRNAKVDADRIVAAIRSAR